jgi:hypothetical protein
MRRAPFFIAASVAEPARRSFSDTCNAAFGDRVDARLDPAAGF